MHLGTMGEKSTITDNSARKLSADWAVRIAVSSSSRNGVVGIGGAIKIQNNEI